MKLKQGDILVCGPEQGCGIKLVVIEACDEMDCDMKCCGKDMAVLQKKGGTGCCKQDESDPEIWKKYAQKKEEK